MITLLTTREITQKISRLAIQIVERNYGEEEIVIAGINQNGYRFAQLLLAALQQTETFGTAYSLAQIRLHLDNLAGVPAELSVPASSLTGKSILIADDVANTGKTLYYALQPFFALQPKQMQIAVLIDRSHKTFPIRPDFVGLSLATTFQEHIDVQLNDAGKEVAYLR